MFLLLGIDVLGALPIGHARREEQVAKHARPRKYKKTEETHGQALKRRERTRLMIRIAVLIYGVARSISGN